MVKIWYTKNLTSGEPSQPPNSSWPLSQNGTNAEATLAANLTFSSYYQHTSPVAAMFIVAYAFIFLLCMVGNTLVCFIVLKNRHMRTVTNMFILNLAVSDLLVGIFCMPTTLVDNLITAKAGNRSLEGRRRCWAGLLAMRGLKLSR
ncbi:Neuropeptide FF receptor 1 [Saguinus oedipus]|uniref:Neuropeptide FF receptor 1 n=1 Tax=Saguinus oedipus TaxID=9490 RepID=A0ABQ9UNY8_SAGOE|nr:Neuropeptide FF receptor 1 [Saguinus oedipus]